MTLRNKSAIITGAGGGIGECLAEKFVSEGANPVFLLGRDEKKLIDLAGKLEERYWLSGVIVLPCDVTKEAEVKEAIDFAIWHAGFVDILINVAGIAGDYALAQDADLQKWQEVFAVNFFGTFLTMKHILPHMMQKRSGKIINFAGGGDGPLPGFAAYVASKVAVVRLTETIAKEIQAFGIDVNVIAPGPVKTKLFDQVSKYSGYNSSLTVNPAKAAELAVFLASEKSNGLTGRFLSAIWDKWELITDPENWSVILADPNVFKLRRQAGDLGWKN